MPIDAGIYGQLQQQPQQVNPLASLAQAYQIKGVQAQLDKADRAEQQQNRLLALVQGPDFQKMDAQGKANALQGLGDFDNAGKVITSAAAANKDQRAADQTGLEMAIKRHEAMSGAMMGLSQDPSQAPQVIQQLVQVGIMDPAYGQKVLQSASQAQDPSAFFRQGAMAAVSAKDQLAQRIQMGTQAETNRHNLAMEGTAAGTLQNSRDRLAFDQNQPKGQVVQSDDGPILVDPRTGTGKTITGPDGKPLAGVTKPLNDSQSKALLFGSRMRDADKILNQLSSEGTDTSTPFSMSKNIAGSAINALSSGNQQMLNQAKLDFMSAVLRRESGAAISEGEYTSADKQYFPQIGDDQKVIAQKARNRQLAIQGILQEVPEKQRGALQTMAPEAAKPAAGVMAVTDAASYAKVPSGATYTTPDGKTRRKP